MWVKKVQTRLVFLITHVSLLWDVGDCVFLTFFFPLSLCAYRLFWPKSKSYDYLYSDGQALLRNFPVQATISFYEDPDSDDDDEDDDEEEELMEAEQKRQSREGVKSHPHFSSLN